MGRRGGSASRWQGGVSSLWPVWSGRSGSPGIVALVAAAFSARSTSVRPALRFARPGACGGGPASSLSSCWRCSRPRPSRRTR
eukprot:3529815-Lingulodinium_polyedra.AAC.1